jgi:AcrR family transcriptional regulator
MRHYELDICTLSSKNVPSRTLYGEVMKVRTKARREAIISEATKLFCQNGFERTSMSEIAKQLGGSKTTLYNYFSSKEALFEAVIENIAVEHLDPAIKELLEPNGLEIKETLLRFGELIISLINQADALAVYRMVLGEAGRSDVGLLFYKIGPQRVNDALREFITNAIKNKDLRPCDPEVAASHILFLIKSESDQNLFKCSPPILEKSEIKAMVTRAVDVFMAAYSAA